MTPVAITQRQPFASLLAHGIAEWHTSRARPRLEPGQEVWVHAGKQRPEQLSRVGEWCAWQAIDGSWSMGNRLDPTKPHEWAPLTPLPLGAVLSRHRLAEVVPIVGEREASAHLIAGDDPRPYPYLIAGSSTLMFVKGRYVYPDISDQLPFADWSPGRWAWRLELIERLETPVAEYPVPVDDAGCSTSYCFGATGAEMEQYPICKGCNYDGTRMVPVRGRPGIWHPDRGLIAAVRGEG